MEYSFISQYFNLLYCCVVFKIIYNIIVIEGLTIRFLVFVCTFSLILISCQKSSNKNSKRVVLISIDGFRPDFYLDSEFKTPFLKKLKAESSYADGMISVFPSVTYPNHTTLVTGKYPAEHGILSNMRFNDIDGPTTEWYWDGKHIKTETLWSIAKENKLKTASLHWPVTQNLDIDFLVPEIFQAPPWHTEKSFEVATKFSNPKNLTKEINQKLNLEPYTNMKEADIWAYKAFKEIYTNKKPDFFALHIIYADKNQHDSGRDSIKTKNAIKWIDNNIKDLYQVLDKNTCLIILGDHGFMNYQTNIHINALFQEKGWLSLSEDKKKITSWKVVANKSGAQASIYLKDNSIKEEVVKFLMDNQTLGYEYISEESLSKMKAHPGAIAALSAQDGFSIGNNLSGEVVEKLNKTKGQHGHLPNQKKMHTGLLMHNCSVKNKNLGIVKNLRIAPTILKELGVKVPSDMQTPIN